MNAFPVNSYANSRRKFAWEWLAALLLLLACLPLFALCALLVFCADGTPVLFRQQRVGKDRRLFFLVKFRSMRAANGLRVTAGTDNRITRAGRLLRATKLDELPQLWNVLKGDMALVGPRPEVPEFVPQQSPEWSAVLLLRPGITGAASLRYRNEDSLLAEVADPILYYRETVLPAKLSLELHYLQSCSFFGDLRLLWKTGTFFLSPK